MHASIFSVLELDRILCKALSHAPPYNIRFLIIDPWDDKQAAASSHEAQKLGVACPPLHS